MRRLPIQGVNMSAPLPGSRHTSCLTPAVEKVLAWHRQRPSFALSAFDEAPMSEAPIAAAADAVPALPAWAQAADPSGVVRGLPPEETRRPDAARP
jgi:hypothetical protein